MLDNANSQNSKATQFLTLLDPLAADFSYQTFDDDQREGHVKNPALSRHTIDAAEVTRLYGGGAGVFVTINETDLKGRKLSNIVRVRAVWQEDDDGKHGDALPLPPSMVVESSPGHFHRYWLVDGEWPADDQGRKDFKAAMEAMVKSYGSDPNAKDIARVLRVPGFLHRKDPDNPFMVRIVEASGVRYSREAILEAFTPMPDVADEIARLAKLGALEYANERKEAASRLRMTLAALDRAVKEKQREARRFEPEPGEDDGVDVASRCRDALRAIPADDRDVWLRMGMALKDSLGENGRSIWDEWSKTSDKFNEQDQDATWQSFGDRADGVGIGTLFYLARDHGWKGRPVGLPEIQIKVGRLSTTADAIQRALWKANQPVFRRAGRLVQPIWTAMKTVDGRMTKACVLWPLSLTTLSYMITKHAAVFVKWDGRAKGLVRANIPNDAVQTVLDVPHGTFPQIAGVINTPTMRPDGSILATKGFDAATELWYEPEFDLDLPPIPERPTKADAHAALDRIKDLLLEFPFKNPLDRSVALAGLLTLVLRGAFPQCPLFLIRAHAAGTGKSYLVTLIGVIATGRAPPAITASKNEEEMDKRLGSLLLEGVPIIFIDNLSFNLESEMLCSTLTEKYTQVRILGKSQMPTVEFRGVGFVTGNNIYLKGDLAARRGLCSNLDAELETPHLRNFAGDPCKTVVEDRGRYIADILTIARAYLTSGERAECAPIVGYEAWRKFVCEPLVWLGEVDPLKSVEEVRAEDPELTADTALIDLWLEHVGVSKPCKASEVIKIASATLWIAEEGAFNSKGHNELKLPEFHDLLIEHAGAPNKRDVDPKLFGAWLKKLKGKIINGHRLTVAKVDERRGNKWRLDPKEYWDNPEEAAQKEAKRAEAELKADELKEAERLAGERKEAERTEAARQERERFERERTEEYERKLAADRAKAWKQAIR